MKILSQIPKFKTFGTRSYLSKQKDLGALELNFSDAGQNLSFPLSPTQVGRCLHHLTLNSSKPLKFSNKNSRRKGSKEKEKALSIQDEVDGNRFAFIS